MAFRDFFKGRTDKYNGASAIESYLDTHAGDIQRVYRYRDNWRAYFGVDLNPDLVSTKTTKEKSAGETKLKINYTMISVNKMAAFAFSRPWAASVDLPYADKTDEALTSEEKAERDTLTKMLSFCNDVVTKDNPADSIRMETAIYGGVTGDMFWVVSPAVPGDVRTVVSPDGTVKANLKDTPIRIMLINPEYVVRFIHSPGGKELIYVQIRYPQLLPKEFQDSTYSRVGIFEHIITPDTVYETYYDEKGSSKLGTTREVVNAIKKVFVVHIKNMPSPGPCGLDDVTYVKDLVQELNDKMGNISEIIDYHSAPTTVVYGARASTLEKGANKVWSGLPANAKVENLQLETDLGAATSFVTSLREMIKETTGLNNIALGTDQAVSNTSGVALHTMFYSMVTQANMKWSEWAPCVKLLYDIILSWGKVLEQVQYDDGMLRRFIRVFSVMFSTNLPKDDLLEIQKNTEAVRAGIRLRSSALRNLGDPNPQQTLKQIETELTEYPKSASLIGVPDQNAENNAGKGNLDGKGEGANIGGTGTNVSGLRHPTEV